MKILIRKVLVPVFMTLGGEWTADLSEAAEFKSGATALEFCARNKVQDAEIYYKFDRASFDFTTYSRTQKS